MYNYCRSTPEPLNGTKFWPKSENEYGRLCSRFSSGGNKCEEGSVCGNPIEFDISLEEDGVYTNANIRYGLASFDNFFQALLAVF